MSRNEGSIARYKLETVVQLKFKVGRSVAGKFLVCLGVTALAANAFDPSAWKAYEAVEEAWIRECHAFVIQQAPAAVGVAQMDLEIKLTELRLRALTVDHLA